MTVIEWPGKSGIPYTFEVFRLGAKLPDRGGIYCFAQETKLNTFTPIYFGQTNNFSDRITISHHKRSCINQSSATHIHIHFDESNEFRIIKEKDLISGWKARNAANCND